MDEPGVVCALAIPLTAGCGTAWIHARGWTGKAGNGKIEAPNVRCKQKILAAVADPAQRAPVRSLQ
jgi:hypothetical protein